MYFEANNPGLMSNVDVAGSCLNCNAELISGTVYCGQCGQHAQVHRLNGNHFLHEVTHAFTHADKNIFTLIWQLLYRPGEIAREYVKGKRKKYFSPLTFLVISVGISSLIMYNTGFVDFSKGLGKNAFSGFMNSHTNLIIYMNIPILAFFNLLLFRKSGFNYWEHLVFVCFVSAERSLFFCAIVAPTYLIFPGAHNYIIFLYLVVWIIYFAYASKQFLGSDSKASYPRFLLVPILSQVVIMILVTSIILLYLVIRK